MQRPRIAWQPDHSVGALLAVIIGGAWIVTKDINDILEINAAGLKRLHDVVVVQQIKQLSFFDQNQMFGRERNHLFHKKSIGDQFGDNRVRLNAVGFGVEIGNETQNGQSDFLHIMDIRRKPAFQKAPRLGREYQILRSSGPAPSREEIFDHFFGADERPGFGDETDGVIDHGIRHGHGAGPGSDSP